MKKVRFFSFLLLIGLMGGIAFEGFNDPSHARGANAYTLNIVDLNKEDDSAPLIKTGPIINDHCETSNLSEGTIDTFTEWNIYIDTDIHFSLTYPRDREHQTTVEQFAPHRDPEAIIKRETFSGIGGMVDVDIWLANGMTLTEWLQWYDETRNPLPNTLQNATIANQPAVIFVEDTDQIDMLTAFFSDGKYVFRLWYSVTQSIAGLQTYFQMAESFRLFAALVNPLEMEEIALAFRVPDHIIQQAHQSVAESSLPEIQVLTCCGYTSNAGNTFPCCCCPDKGNCTWWVYYRYGSVPFKGNADTWWRQVPDYPTWSRGSVPRFNWRSIAYWAYGHVAYVPYYRQGDSQVTISEMLWCSSCGRTRTISVTNPNGYIFEREGGPSGQEVEK